MPTPNARFRALPPYPLAGMKALRRKIDALGVGDLVRLAGPCSDPAAAYKLSSVVVSAARQDSSARYARVTQGVDM